MKKNEQLKKKKQPSQVRVFLRAPGTARDQIITSQGSHLQTGTRLRAHSEQVKGTIVVPCALGSNSDQVKGTIVVPCALDSNSPFPLNSIIKPEVEGSDIGTRDTKTKELKC